MYKRSIAVTGDTVKAFHCTVRKVREMPVPYSGVGTIRANAPAAWQKPSQPATYDSYGIMPSDAQLCAILNWQHSALHSNIGGHRHEALDEV